MVKTGKTLIQIGDIWEWKGTDGPVHRVIGFSRSHVHVEEINPSSTNQASSILVDFYLDNYELKHRLSESELRDYINSLQKSYLESENEIHT